MQANNMKKEILIGEEPVTITQVQVQNRFQMMVPESFEEDTQLAYRYTSFSSREESPLGIAIRYAMVSSPEAKQKMVSNYFSGDATVKSLEGPNGILHYRESVYAGAYISIYLLRFVVEVSDGLLLGCFNCMAANRDAWHPGVLEMLQSIKEIQLEG